MGDAIKSILIDFSRAFYGGKLQAEPGGYVVIFREQGRMVHVSQVEKHAHEGLRY